MGFGGMGLSGINQAGAFGSLQTEGVQFGYNFKNSPVSVYGGFDTLKYNSGIGGAFSPFDSVVQHAPATARMRASNSSRRRISACRSASATSSPGRLDTDTKSPSLSNASQFDLVGGRR